MGVIPSELSDFKNKVYPNVSKMDSTCSNIVDKIHVCINSGKNAENSIDKYYNSKNKSTVMAGLNDLESMYNTIEASLSNNLKKILSESTSLIDKITELEEINRLNSLFEKKKEEAIEQLKKLKSMDSSIELENSSDSSETPLAKVNGGTFEKKTYVSSNGYEIEYYIFVPDTESTEGLPVNMYLHGTGEMGDRILSKGLPKQLANGEITPSGIVICPQTKKEELYYNEGYRAEDLYHKVLNFFVYSFITKKALEYLEFVLKKM